MRWPLVTRSMLEESHRLALRGVVIERDELRASLGLTKAALDEALQRVRKQDEEFILYRQAMDRPPKANAALLDARREIEHLRVDLAEARRTAKSAEEANRQLRDTIRAHQSLGSIVAQFKPMLRRIAKAQPEPVKPPSRRAKQKGGAS